MKDVIKILGVRIDNLRKEEAESKMCHFIKDDKSGNFIVTVNPEIILKAYCKKEYRDILNSSDLNICDGFGIRLAGLLKGNRIKHRWAGADIADYLLEKAEKSELKVLIVVGGDSLSRPLSIKEAVKEKYPELKIEVRYFEKENFFENAFAKSADIVFVNFGAPGQEEFIARHRNRFPEAKILVGVGGTFDFFTGKMKRAPKHWRRAGFEWLWRLIQEPKRIKRIINAVVVFPILAVFKK